MSFLKKPSKTRSLRKKLDDTSPEKEPPVNSVDTVGNEANPMEIDEPQIPKPPKLKKEKKPKPAVTLSFDAEEETEEVFQVKKSHASKRMARSKNKKLTLACDSLPEAINLDKATISSRTYTREHLEELRVTSICKDKEPADIVAEKFPLTFGADADGIPDANAVHAARLRRQMARENPGSVTEPEMPSKSKDFISLDGDESDKRVGRYTGMSRLIREEDELDDAEGEYTAYVGDKMAITAKAVKQQELQRISEMQASLTEFADREDEEENEHGWELDQIRKGGYAKIDKITGKIEDRNSHKGRSKKVPSAAPIPSLSSLRSRLADSLRHIQQQHAFRVQQLEQIMKDREEAEAAEKSLAGDVARESARYTYHQELNQYVMGLADFLNTKAPLLEELENEFRAVILEKAYLVIDRTQKDMEDDCILLLGPDAKELYSASNAVDEFGRDAGSAEDAARVRRRTAYANRRSIRISAQCETNEHRIEDPEGVSSDDDLEDETSDQLAQRQVDVLNQNRHLFDDALEEYGALPAVCGRMQTWQNSHREDYDRVYGGLSLPGAFDVFIRHEMIGWEPFNTTVNFEDTPWHKHIASFGGASEDDAMREDDAELNLLNKVVTKTILPDVIKMVDSYDPRSSRQTKIAKNLMEQLLYYMEPTSEGFSNLQEMLYRKFETAVAFDREIHAVARSPLRVDSAKSASEARNRSFWRSFRLFCNIIELQNYLPPGKSKALALTSLLPGRLLVLLNLETISDGFEPDDVRKYDRLVTIIPADWIGTDQQPSIELLPLETALNRYVTEWEERGNADRNCIEILVRTLARLNSLKEAARIAKLYKVRI